MTKKNIELTNKIKKKLNITFFISFFTGTILLVYSFFELFITPKEQFSASYLNPAFELESLFMILGIVLILNSIYIFKNFKKIVKEKIEKN